MEQFYAVKENFPDSILFFRMGDFFEMFEEDAVVASKILGIALTSRNKNSENQTSMCGVPHHSYQQYMLKLIKAGYKVAICEQLEDPAVAKGIVKRGVTRVVSPGTIMDAGEITDAANNFLVAVHSEEGRYYVATADISTGEVYLTDCPAELSEEGHAEDYSALNSLLASFQPKELLCSTPMRIEFSPPIVRPSVSTGKASRVIADLYGISDARQLGIE